MAEITQIVKIAKKLREGIDEPSELKKIFEFLEKLEMTMDILKTTHIGNVLNNFRKRIDDSDIKNRTKELIRKWKSIPEIKNKQDNPKKEEKEKKSVDPIKIQYPHVLRPSHTADGLRLKMRTLLTGCLNSKLYQGINFEALAAVIEDHVFENCKGTNDKYNVTMRCKMMSLKGKYKETVMDSLFKGTLTAHDYATKDYTEYSGDDIKNQVKKYVDQGKDKNTFVATKMSSSTMYQCGKCKAKDTSYTQAQTRSADEPMTTFITCNKCGNKWKQ